MSTQSYASMISLLYPNVRFSNYMPSSSVTQANGMIMIGGSDFGVTDNSLTRVNATTLIDLLESKNIGWKVYAEDYPGSCYLNEGVSTYKRYRVPFLSLTSVQSNRYLCMNVVGFGYLNDDIKYNNLSQVSVIIPNIPSSGAITNVQTADKTLKRILDPILKNADLLDQTTVIISTINNSTAGQPEMFTQFIGKGVKQGSGVVKTNYSHANLLRTIEDGLRLGNLHQTDASAGPMVGFWK